MTDEKRTAPEGSRPHKNSLKSLAHGVVFVNIGWRPIRRPPTKDGDYNVLHKNGWCASYGFTTDGGWNTYWLEDKLLDVHAMDLEELGFIAWAPLLEVRDALVR